MQKKVDEKFQALKDKYYTIEMNVSSDREMLNREKARLHTQQENQVLVKKGAVYSAITAAFFAILACIPMGVATQIVIGALSLTGVISTVACVDKSFKYNNKIEDTKNTIKIVEDRLKGYEEERKAFSKQSQEYFKDKQIAPQNSARPIKTYEAPQSEAKPMPAHIVKDDGMSL